MFGKDGPTFFELINQSLVSTRQGYDLLAPKFDATPFRTPDAVLQPAIDAIGRVDAALDVCCGTGAAMQLLKPLCRTRLAGIDFSPGMLEIARKKAAQVTGLPAGEFFEGDVLEMNFKEEFDLATCFGALGHILPADERTFIRRVRAALKPGGRFIFATAGHPRLWSRATLIYRTFNLVMHIRNALLKPPFIMYYLNFLLPEVETLLREERFAVEVRTKLFPPPFHGGCLVIATRLD
jgi:ubiquinone/menaquinone biosynthesis C-methylase UbiE